MEESSISSPPHKKAKDSSEELDIPTEILERYRRSDAPDSFQELFGIKIYNRNQALTPLNYFLGIIQEYSRISIREDAYEDEEVDVLSRILVIVLPKVREKAEVMSNSAVAVQILALGAQQHPPWSEIGFTVVECMGQLLLDVFDCDWKDWESFRLGIETLIKLSLIPDPKVRKFARDCVVKVLKTLEHCQDKRRAIKWISQSLIDGSASKTGDYFLGPDMLLDLLKLVLHCIPGDLVYDGLYIEIHNCLRTLSKPMCLLAVSEAVLELLESVDYQVWIPDKWKKEYYHVAATTSGFS